MDKIAIKAGMGNIDRARVESIIDRMTRNRLFRGFLNILFFKYIFGPLNWKSNGAKGAARSGQASH